MTALPPTSDFTGATRTEAQMKTSFADLRAFLAGLLGADGTAGTALGLLGALVSGLAAKSAAYTVNAADRGRVIDASGTWTLSLLAAATAGAGFTVILRNQGGGIITLDPSGAELIDGAATVPVGTGRGALLICTGTAWITINLSGLANGQTRAIDGTAAAPGFAFSADSDTGLHRPAADQIALITAGLQRALLSTAAFQLDLPLTGTAVQADGTDTTVGRLVRLAAGSGVFGLGLPDTTLALPPSDNLTTLRTSGFWRYQSTTTGKPAPSAGVVLHLVRLTGTGSSTHLQFAWSASASEPLSNRRLQSDGSWTAWSRVFTQENLLGTVAQAAGVPTGAVIERGSNANGDYVRFADGTQICSATVTLSLAISTALAGGCRSVGQTWNYPAVFAALPAFCPTVQGATAFGVISHSTGTGSGGGWAVTSVTTQAAADRTVSLLAIGRWF